MKKYSIALSGAILAGYAVFAEQPADMPARKGPESMPVRMFGAMDSNKDGRISREEWQAHHEQRFTEMDADKDGSVSADELREHHARMREKLAESCPDCPRGKKGMRKGRRKKTPDEDSE